MAGLPLDRPIPGVPLIDPLAGMEPPPEEPPAWPPPFAEELAGPPTPAPALTVPPQFPPPHWFANPEGVPPSEWQNQDVPTLEPTPPVQEPPATTQAGPQGMAALDQARKDGHLLEPYPEEKAKPQRKLTEEEQYIAHLNRTADAKQQAIEDAASAQQRKNDYEREQGILAAQDATRRQNEADAAYMKVQDEAKAKRAELDAEAVAIANQKIDPKRAWNNMSFGEQLFVGITAALTGATTRAVQTGQNPVLAMVTAAAERDMKAQQLDLENRTNVLGVRRGLLADDLAAGRDILDFRYKSLNAAYTMAQNQIKAYTLKYDNEILTAKGSEAIATLEDGKVKEYLAWKTATEEKIYKREQDRIKNAQQWKGLSLQERQIKAQEEAARADAAMGPALAERKFAYEQQKDLDAKTIPNARTKDGKVLTVLDATEAAKARKDMAMTTSMTERLDELEAIYAKHGYQPFKEWSGGEGGEDAKRARVIMGHILPMFSMVNEQGVIRDREYPMYLKMFGDATGFLDPRANLKEARAMAVRTVNNNLRSYAGDDNVAWWEPKKTPTTDKSFDQGAMPKKQPGVVGIPAEGRQLGQDPLLSPEQQQFIDSGKFVPSTQDPAKLLDFVDGAGGSRGAVGLPAGGG